MPELVVIPGRCGECLYFDRTIGDEENGGCRRYPPVLDPHYGSDEVEGYTAWWWPTVQSDDWCGEHKPKEGV